MGFISGAEKLQSAQQIKQWYDSANSTIISLNTTKQSIVSQLALMQNNIDYSEADCLEVQALINDLNSKIATL